MLLEMPQNKMFNFRDSRKVWTWHCNESPAHGELWSEPSLRTGKQHFPKIFPAYRSPTVLWERLHTSKFESIRTGFVAHKTSVFHRCFIWVFSSRKIILRQKAWFEEWMPFPVLSLQQKAHMGTQSKLHSDLCLIFHLIEFLQENWFHYWEMDLPSCKDGGNQMLKLHLI